MFPRRRTDQVYATLQQVQRRISESSGSPTSAATPAGMTAPTGRTPVSSPTLRSGPQIPSPDAPPASPPLLAPGVAAHQRYAVVLSGTLATLLLVCWLASLAVAIVITWQVRRPATASGSDGPRIAAPAAPADAEPRWKLIVKVEQRATPEARRTLIKMRDDNNAIMRGEKAIGYGWKPLFEVEEPVNGSVQLVFAPQGVDRYETKWVELAKKLRGSTWAEVR